MLVAKFQLGIGVSGFIGISSKGFTGLVLSLLVRTAFVCQVAGVDLCS